VFHNRHQNTKHHLEPLKLEEKGRRLI